MSTLTTLISSGGGGGATGEVFTVLESSTFVFPYSGKVKIYCIGGGGSGGLSSNGNGSVGAGGAAGGTAVKILDVTTDDSLICVIGAGGASTTSQPSNGNSGGQSTVNSNNLAVSLTANGGSGGVGTTFSNGGTFGNVSGAGTGSGGDYNFTGGSGGALYASTGGGANSNQGRYTTGGGATGLNADGISGGNITANNAQYSITAGGSIYGSPINLSKNNSNGLSVGGRAASGLKDPEPFNNTNDVWSIGGSVPTVIQTVASNGMDASNSVSELVKAAMRGEGASGGYDTTNAARVNGGPGGGCAPSQVNSDANGHPNAGMFGGGGGATGTGLDVNVSGSDGGLGGGGGGGGARVGNATPLASGAGGDGMIIIQYV